jgi:hypothetical protein
MITEIINGNDVPFEKAIEIRQIWADAFGD